MNSPKTEKYFFQFIPINLRRANSLRKNKTRFPEHILIKFALYNGISSPYLGSSKITESKDWK
jgi:hypothetical protein